LKTKTEKGLICGEIAERKSEFAQSVSKRKCQQLKYKKMERIKNWIIIKLGGIPLSYLTPEESQRIHNRRFNEAVDNCFADNFSKKVRRYRDSNN
jgi:hypothetical protein